MLEAYGANKYKATGFIQRTLNSAGLHLSGIFTIMTLFPAVDTSEPARQTSGSCAVPVR